MKYSCLVALLLLQLCPLTFGIGRTGNGVSDETEQFKAQTPMEYSTVQPMGLGNLRLISQIPFGNGSFSQTPTEIELLKIRTQFPEFDNYSRESIGTILIEDRWNKFVPTQKNKIEDCLDLYFFETEGAVGGLAIWGQQKGILIRALNKSRNKAAIELILSTLELEIGACDWK